MKTSAREIAIFGMIGGIMYAQKLMLAALPNIHLTAVLITALTIHYRKKALYPIYVYVFLEGLFGGFSAWWIPYLYVWTVLWAVVMALPGDLKTKKYGPLAYMAVCGLHGLLFGALFAPAQALLFGMSFKAMLAWIAAGLSFDVIHGVSNFILGSLVIPLAGLFEKLEKASFR